MQKIKQFIDWIKNNPVAMKALNTFWQGAAATFLVGLTPLWTLATSGKLKESAVYLVGLAIASVAFGLSAVKTYLVNRFKA